MNWNMQALLPKRKSPRWEPNGKPLAQQKQAINATATLSRHDGAALVSDTMFCSNHIIMQGGSIP